MNNNLIKSSWIVLVSSVFASIVISGPPVMAHYLEDNLNHAHVCTSKDSLTVRTSYSASSKSLGSLPKGTVLKVLGSYYNNINGESWVHIKYNNGTAFVNGAYVCY